MSQGQIVDFLRPILANDQVRVILLLILANIAAGVAASLASGTFRLFALADFCRTRLVPYLLGYASIRLVAEVMPEYQPVAGLVWALILAALLGHMAACLDDFGINLPDMLNKSKTLDLQAIDLSTIGSSLADGMDQVTKALVKAVSAAAAASPTPPSTLAKQDPPPIT